MVLAIITVVLFPLLAAGAAFSSLVPLQQSQYPVFHDDLQLHGLNTTLDLSLAFLRTVPASTTYTLAGVSVPVQRLMDSLLFLQHVLQSSPTAEQLNQEIQRAYTVYRIDGGPGANGDLLNQCNFALSPPSGRPLMDAENCHPAVALDDAFADGRADSETCVGRPFSLVE